MELGEFKGLLRVQSREDDREVVGGLGPEPSEGIDAKSLH